MMAPSKTALLPGTGLDSGKIPGHWLLARLGKRVLRPGGVALTRQLLEALAIQPSDSVVEFAPGLGATARLTLARPPAAYTAIERDEQAALNLRRLLNGPGQQCLPGSADQTPLPSSTATVVYGEAMLTMQGQSQKARIVREAFRLLRPGGRYGLHEMCFTKENLDDKLRGEIQDELSETLRVVARPLTIGEWRALLEAEGFAVKQEQQTPMHLLEPIGLLRDEGLLGASRLLWNVLRDGDARRRVAAMRRIFNKYQAHWAAVMLVAVKPPAESLRPDED